MDLVDVFVCPPKQNLNFGVKGVVVGKSVRFGGGITIRITGP